MPSSSTSRTPSPPATRRPRARRCSRIRSTRPGSSCGSTASTPSGSRTTSPRCARRPTAGHAAQGVATPRRLRRFGAGTSSRCARRPPGVLAAAEIAAIEHVVALFWGAEDLVASLGGIIQPVRATGATATSPAWHAPPCCWPRAANDIAAIDSVFMDITDLDGLKAEAEDAVASGFAATACIHPSQVETIRAAYRPTEAQVAHARAVARGGRGSSRRLHLRGPDGGRTRAAARAHAARSCARSVPS